MNRKTDTEKTLKPWPVLVDHYKSLLMNELMMFCMVNHDTKNGRSFNTSSPYTNANGRLKKWAKNNNNLK